MATDALTKEEKQMSNTSNSFDALMKKYKGDNPSDYSYADTAFAQDAGTSAGVKKAWLKRERAKQDSDLDGIDKNKGGEVLSFDGGDFRVYHTTKTSKEAPTKEQAEQFPFVLKKVGADGKEEEVTRFRDSQMAVDFAMRGGISEQKNFDKTQADPVEGSEQGDIKMGASSKNLLDAMIAEDEPMNLFSCYTFETGKDPVSEDGSQTKDFTNWLANSVREADEDGWSDESPMRKVRKFIFKQAVQRKAKKAWEGKKFNSINSEKTALAEVLSWYDEADFAAESDYTNGGQYNEERAKNHRKFANQDIKKALDFSHKESDRCARDIVQKMDAVLGRKAVKSSALAKAMLGNRYDGFVSLLDRADKVNDIEDGSKREAAAEKLRDEYYALFRTPKKPYGEK